MRKGPLPEHEKENLRQLYKGKPRVYRRTTKYRKQVNIKYHNVRKAAITRDILFDLSRKQVEKPCHYCGKESDNLGFINTYKTAGINGLDRLDSTKLYILDNVVTCCKTCNWAKNSLSAEEFCAWVQRIYNHMFGVKP